jgi:hypothetical protein
VAKADVLARVRDDLALGHTHVAVQRLRTLLAVHPNDLEVYRLLAAVYRQTGNRVEAGRWAFLTDELRDEELAAFERAHPSPWLRLRLVRWTGDPDQLPSEAGRQRLLALVDAAGESGPPDRFRTPDKRGRSGTALACLFVAIVLLTLVGLFGLGLYRVVQWIIH